MSRQAIVGDIHGMYIKLIELLDKLPKNIDQIYTVGDLIDRGPDSKEVVQECIDRGIKCVKGNHEDMMISYIGERGEYDPGIFEMNGGIATLESYSNEDKIVDIPDNHLEFMINMPYYIVLSHAGVSTHIEKEFRDCSERSQRELMWDRTSKAKNLGKLQVFGHTPNKEVEFLTKWNALNERNDIVGVNVDTAALVTGCLTAVLIPSLEIIST